MRICAGAQHGACVGENALGICCGTCNVAWYCSPIHQEQDRKDHARICQRWAQQAQSASLLDDFPFEFTSESKQVGCCKFLEKHGLHKHPLWKNECECSGQTYAWGLNLHEEGLSWGLAHGLCPCEDPKTSLTWRLQSWSDFYSWRKLPFDSVSALLLHWPLTLYHAIHMASGKLDLHRHIHIHYLGAEKELDQLPVFAELLSLFPDINIRIDFVGPRVHASSFQLGSLLGCLGPCDRPKRVHQNHVSICLWRGLYHELYAKMSKPDLIFIPNAGLPVFLSWQPTISLLVKLPVPLIVTDYCEEACLLAVDCFLKQDRLTIPVQVNPFRQPLVPWNKTLDVPTYSNCFIFGKL